MYLYLLYVLFKMKFPAYNGTGSDIHIDWFIMTFKDEKSKDGSLKEIRARDIWQLGDRKIETCEYRKLMQLAYEKKHVCCKDYPCYHRKYSVCFDLDRYPTIDRFDLELLSHPMMKNLPPSEMLDSSTNITENEILLWKAYKIQWTEILKAFYQYQNEGIVKGDSFPDWWSDDTKRIVSAETNIYIYKYKAMKLGWEKVYIYRPDLSGNNYNDIFLKIMMVNSINSVRDSFSFLQGENPYRSIRNCVEVIIKAREEEVFSPAGYANNLKDDINDLQKAEQILLRILNVDFNQRQLPIWASGQWIQECLEKSENHQVQKALKEWRKAITSHLKVIRTLNRRLTESTTKRSTEQGHK